jgi:SEC-C motif
MSKISRNDPCPCGSGKKYKKCCLLAADTQEFEYRRWRHVEAGLIPRLIQFASENLGPQIVGQAWKEFNESDTMEECDPSSEMNMVFLPWFLFSWEFELKPTNQRRYIETTVAEQFLQRNAALLTADEKALLLSAVRVPFSLYEIVEVKPGVGMTQFDLLRRIKYDVIERSASQTLKRGEIIYCATTEINGMRSNLATSPYALRPTSKLDVLRLRKWMVEEAASEELTAEDLHNFEADIRGLYLTHLKSMLTPPRLANTDGDPLLPQKVYFDLLVSADAAFQAVKDLAKGTKRTELLRSATIERGSIIKADLPWLGGKAEARKRLAGKVLLGNIKIDRDRLIAEVNSNRRAQRIRRLIERRLGPGAKYKTTVIEPIESQFQERWKAAAGGARSEANDTEGSSALSIDAPEVRAMMEETARQHWEAWFDLPVPALDNMTPRQAAKTREGRELLESLLLLYEHHSDADSRNAFRPDIAALRRELGIN